MKKRKIVVAIVTAIICILIWVIGSRTVARAEPTVIVTEQKPKPTLEQLDLEHRQETWISALEWCESRGRNDALNKVDRDGTPSYSNFQWKPGTLLYYGKMYKYIATTTSITSIPELLKDYELQRNVVRSMVKDPGINWYQQFPDCVKLKVGLPPRK